jgi:hypothetical protein
MTTQAKHTPGPWRIGDAGVTVFGPPNGNPSPITIARIVHPEKANTRLIAAAPELLEACKAALDGLSNMTIEQYKRGDDRQLRNSLQAAIAKAEGR